MHQGIGPYRCELLPESSDVREGGQQDGCHPAAGKGHPGTGDNCPGQSEAGAIQGKQCSGEELKATLATLKTRLEAEAAKSLLE